MWFVLLHIMYMLTIFTTVFAVPIHYQNWDSIHQEHKKALHSHIIFFSLHDEKSECLHTMTHIYT